MDNRKNDDEEPPFKRRKLSSFPSSNMESKKKEFLEMVKKKVPNSLTPNLLELLNGYFEDTIPCNIVRGKMIHLLKSQPFILKEFNKFLPEEFEIKNEELNSSPPSNNNTKSPFNEENVPSHMVHPPPPFPTTYDNTPFEKLSPTTFTLPPKKHNERGEGMRIVVPNREELTSILYEEDTEEDDEEKEEKIISSVKTYFERNDIPFRDGEQFFEAFDFMKEVKSRCPEKYGQIVVIFQKYHQSELSFREVEKRVRDLLGGTPELFHRFQTFISSEFNIQNHIKGKQKRKRSRGIHRSKYKDVGFIEDETDGDFVLTNEGNDEDDFRIEDDGDEDVEEEEENEDDDDADFDPLRKSRERINMKNIVEKVVGPVKGKVVSRRSTRRRKQKERKRKRENGDLLRRKRRSNDKIVLSPLRLRSPAGERAFFGDDFFSDEDDGRYSEEDGTYTPGRDYCSANSTPMTPRSASRNWTFDQPKIVDYAKELERINRYGDSYHLKYPYIPLVKGEERYEVVLAKEEFRKQEEKKKKEKKETGLIFPEESLNDSLKILTIMNPQQTDMQMRIHRQEQRRKGKEVSISHEGELRKEIPNQTKFIGVGRNHLHHKKRKRKPSIQVGSNSLIDGSGTELLFHHPSIEEDEDQSLFQDDPLFYAHVEEEKMGGGNTQQAIGSGGSNHSKEKMDDLEQRAEDYFSEAEVRISQLTSVIQFLLPYSNNYDLANDIVRKYDARKSFYYPTIPTELRNSIAQSTRTTRKTNFNLNDLRTTHKRTILRMYQKYGPLMMKELSRRPIETMKRIISTFFAKVIEIREELLEKKRNFRSIHFREMNKYLNGYLDQFLEIERYKSTPVRLFNQYRQSWYDDGKSGVFFMNKFKDDRIHKEIYEWVFRFSRGCFNSSFVQKLKSFYGSFVLPFFELNSKDFPLISDDKSSSIEEEEDDDDDVFGRVHISFDEDGNDFYGHLLPFRKLLFANPDLFLFFLYYIKLYENIFEIKQICAKREHEDLNRVKITTQEYHKQLEFDLVNAQRREVERRMEYIRMKEEAEQQEALLKEQRQQKKRGKNFKNSPSPPQGIELRKSERIQRQNEDRLPLLSDGHTLSNYDENEDISPHLPFNRDNESIATSRTRRTTTRKQRNEDRNDHNALNNRLRRNCNLFTDLEWIDRLYTQDASSFYPYGHGRSRLFEQQKKDEKKRNHSSLDQNNNVNNNSPPQRFGDVYYSLFQGQLFRLFSHTTMNDDDFRSSMKRLFFGRYSFFFVFSTVMVTFKERFLSHLSSILNSDDGMVNEMIKVHQFFQENYKQRNGSGKRSWEGMNLRERYKEAIGKVLIRYNPLRRKERNTRILKGTTTGNRSRTSSRNNHHPHHHHHGDVHHSFGFLFDELYLIEYYPQQRKIQLRCEENNTILFEQQLSLIKVHEQNQHNQQNVERAKEKKEWTKPFLNRNLRIMKNNNNNNSSSSQTLGRNIDDVYVNNGLNVKYQFGYHWKYEKDSTDLLFYDTNKRIRETSEEKQRRKQSWGKILNEKRKQILQIM